MANGKFRIVTANGIPVAQSGYEARHAAAPLPEKAAIEESHRLIEAFCRIRDPERRAWLVELAQQIATLKSAVS